ncbi:hypothetical protein GLOIN_2v1764901 [Rhizophagus clarus]|uniref:Uncharacterized protein n=1 Tax=Rhizophagus clarus TaxID=94130 RepID=A0A8H3M5W4_9GLOM|nr:hypothetical protein GLOIN_2v1764901 [Rhizophagus clarus]
MPIVNPSVAIMQETNTPFSPSTPHVNDIDIEMEVDYEELPRYNLRSQARNRETEETIGESAENIETESQLPVTFRETDCDPEDLQEASLNDALDTIEGKNKPKHIAEWPSDAYWEFMELIVESNISNKVGDIIIKFFNRHSNLEKSSLPKSTKDGVVKVSQDTESETRIYGEPYECDWWLETEKLLPPMNNLLSVILYSDATTFDGIGKTSGHPVFLTLGNLIQDSGVKTSEAFQALQREIFHKCFNIILQPILEKSDGLYFRIKGREMMFAARISFFIADMLEADDITATYKSARCKMPCHTCMVLREDLNKMDLKCAIPRTHENMQQYQFEFTQEILKDVGGLDLLKVFDDRLRQISRFPGLKLASKVGHLKVVIAADYHHIMKVALFAVDNIFEEWNQITCDELCNLYVKFRKMYIMSRKESYTENELKVFEDAIINWCADFKKIFSTLSVMECSFPKLHSWRYYAVTAICKYGALNGLLTETYETLYKYYVKNPYRSSNRKKVMKRIVKRKELTPSDRKLIYRKEWFSDVAVTSAEDQEQYSSAEGSCSSKEPYELALVR